jgi:N-acetylmuramoyl-L-alanine amidase CwlA
MKKVLKFILVLFLFVALVGCKDKDEAFKAVESLIDNIGEVTLEDEALIKEIEEKYNALSAKDQEKVANLAVLVDAQVTLDSLKFLAELDINYDNATLAILNHLKGKINNLSNDVASKIQNEINAAEDKINKHIKNLEFETAVLALNGEVNKEALAQLDLIYETITDEFKAKLNADIKATYLALSAQAKEQGGDPEDPEDPEDPNKTEEQLAIERYLTTVFPDKVSMGFVLPEVYSGVRFTYASSDNIYFDPEFMFFMPDDDYHDLTLTVHYTLSGVEYTTDIDVTLVPNKYSEAYDFIYNQFRPPIGASYDYISFEDRYNPTVTYQIRSLNPEIMDNQLRLVEKPNVEQYITLMLIIQYPGEEPVEMEMILPVMAKTFLEKARAMEEVYLRYLEQFLDNGVLSQDLILPSEDEDFEVDLTWSSDTPAFLSNDGVYTGPVGNEGAQVVLSMNVHSKDKSAVHTIAYRLYLKGADTPEGWDAIEYFLNQINLQHIKNQSFFTYGTTTKIDYNYGYLPFYNQYDFESSIKVDIVDSSNTDKRSNRLRSETRYITVHNTGMNDPSHNAKLLNDIQHRKDGREASWHFSIDDTDVYQSLPIDEVGYHAGDGTSRALIDYPTGVMFNGNYSPYVDISSDGYYTIDGVKTKVVAPTKEGQILNRSYFTSRGVRVNVINGEYHIPTTYYNSSYGQIANYGGNIASVGIETCVNEGGNFNRTMRHLGKLVAWLLHKYNLGLNDVMQHNDFSGKQCPQDIRNSDRWGELMHLIYLELFALRNFTNKNITFEFKSLTPTIMNDNGEIINHPGVDSVVSYQVKVTYQGETRTYEYTSFVDKLTFQRP